MKLAFAVGVSSLATYRLSKARALCAGESSNSSKLEVSKFINYKTAQKIKALYPTPVYVYDEISLREQATKALQFPHTNGLTVRFAMKSCPNAAILQLFNGMGVNFDASSGYEVERAIRAGIQPSKISLSSQELPLNFKDLIELGIEFNACSLHQLESFGKLFPGRSCGIRFNPGKGSGGTGKTNVGGSTASFGIWYESQSRVQEIAKKHNLKITRIHTHIGSGSDPDVWQAVSIMSLNIVRAFPEVTTLNLGGGYKVGRMSYEKSTDLQQVGRPVSEAFKAFQRDTGRAIKLEIEPGTFLVANAGVLLTTVQDVVSTGEDGHTFLKLDAGMTEVLRPSLYGAQHPIVVHSPTQAEDVSTGQYVVVGHCCESGDLFSCAPGDPETIVERTLSRAVIGDLVTIEGAGAYCSSMSTKNYNSFPEAAEVMLDAKGELHLIRRRQSLTQILENEVPYKK
jgi:diaminopimelate decarboxylase